MISGMIIPKHQSSGISMSFEMPMSFFSFSAQCFSISGEMLATSGDLLFFSLFIELPISSSVHG